KETQEPGPPTLDSLQRRLSQLTTLWSLVCRAHTGPPEQVHSAQQQLLERYGGAVRRYLQAALRCADDAHEIFQNFAHDWLRGALRGADPRRGRFRDYVKTALYHLIAAHHRKGQRWPGQLPADWSESAAAPPSLPDSDRAFLASLRKELLGRAWVA